MIKRFFGFLLLVGLFSADSVLSVTDKRVMEHAPLFSEWLGSANIPFKFFSIENGSLQVFLGSEVSLSSDHRLVEIYYCDAKTFIDDGFMKSHFLQGGGSSALPPFKLLFVYGWNTYFGLKSEDEKKKLWINRRRKVESTYTVFIYYLSSCSLERAHTETVKKECLNKNVSHHEGLGSPAHAAPRLDSAMFPFGASAGLGLPPVGASPADHAREEVAAVVGGISSLAPRVGDKRGLDAPSIPARPSAIQAPPALFLAAAKRVRVINLSDEVVDLMTTAPVADYVDLVTPVAADVAEDLPAQGQAVVPSAVEGSLQGGLQQRSFGGCSSGNRVRRSVAVASFLSYEFSPMIEEAKRKKLGEEDVSNHNAFKNSVFNVLNSIYNPEITVVTLVGVTDETIKEDLKGLAAAALQTKAKLIVAGIQGVLEKENFRSLSNVIRAQGQHIIFDDISNELDLKKPCPGLRESYAGLLPLPADDSDEAEFF
jgi:hypothetical protein